MMLFQYLKRLLQPSCSWQLLILIILISITAGSFKAASQNMDELIELNRRNINNLYNSRGVPPAWLKTGTVDEQDLMMVLNEYEDNVGLLIYSHGYDTLTVTLMDKEGRMFIDHKAISKDSLIDQVDKANRYFSILGQSRAPSLRGSVAHPVNEKKVEYEEAYQKVNEMLLPRNIFPEGFDHLIIVPALNISTFPFAALQISEEKYLVDIMSHSIAPSLFELMVDREKIKSGGLAGANEVHYDFKNALFISNPDFPDDPVWSFPQLPGTATEVKKITEEMDPSVYTILSGEDATITNFKNEICDYDLLYFATHGVSDPGNPLEKSFLVLTKDPDGSLFTAREIQNIRYDCLLNADLVVLSACQTGLGQTQDGGIVGLARAFQIAGANHVLMSLWSIDDQETSVLMNYFFTNLRMGGSMMPHEALRKAIIKYKSEINGDPNYWAAFSILGAPY